MQRPRIYTKRSIPANSDGLVRQYIFFFQPNQVPVSCLGSGSVLNRVWLLDVVNRFSNIYNKKRLYFELYVYFHAFSKKEIFIIEVKIESKFLLASKSCVSEKLRLLVIHKYKEIIPGKH